MKTTIFNLLNGQDTLNKLANTDKLPVVKAYQLSKLLKGINKELELYEATRVKLIQKYGEKKGENITVLPENTEIFYKELREIQELEIELYNFYLKIDELEQAKIEISANELSKVDWLIVDEVEVIETTE